MVVSDLNKIFKAKLSNEVFTKLSEFIYTQYGIKMPPAKKVMLQSRLQKRLRFHNISTYEKYIEYLFSKRGLQEELIHMIDVVSTNKTDFFREPSHFSLLTAKILPEFLKKHQARAQLKIWSAGCSSGEEPYTMSMVLSEFALRYPVFDYLVFASDISSRMLNAAAIAVFPEEKTQVIPLDLKRRYLLRNKDSSKKTVRIIPQLRNRVTFKRLNFIDSVYDTPYKFDIIFCRNVLIYFDRETQEKVIGKLCTRLKPGGYFFLGHSESIMNMRLPLKQVEPTVFLRI